MQFAARLTRVAGPMVLGAVAALGLAPVGAWWLTLPAVFLVARGFVSAPDAWSAARLGWAFGAGYFALGLLWIVQPFLVDIGTYGWMAPFALVFMAGGLALFWGAAFGIAWRMGGSCVGRVLALIATWTLAEYVRAHIFTGFPWAAPAQIWVGTAPAQLLAWAGPHGLDLLTFSAVLPLALVGRGGRAHAAAIPPTVGFALVSIVVGQPAPPVLSEQTVRLIQPNAPQHLKWDPDHVWRFFRRQLYLTAAESDVVPDLVVWPETSVPSFLRNAGPELALVAEAARGAPVVVGLRRAEGQRLFNSLAVLGQGGAVRALYDKHHLVPFGEYMPLGALFARLGIHGLAAEEGGGFSAGPGPDLVPVGAMGRALPLICYEAIFAAGVNGAATRPDLLLQITNDAWFGTWSGPYQHLAQARMRAIEQGLPLVRAANTGISAVIGPRGQVVGALALGEAGYLDAVLPVALAPTLYRRLGDWPALVLAVMLLAAAAALQSRHRGEIGD